MDLEVYFTLSNGIQKHPLDRISLTPLRTTGRFLPGGAMD